MILDIARFCGCFLLGLIASYLLYWLSRAVAVILMGWTIGEFGVYKFLWIRTHTAWRLRSQYARLKPKTGYITAYPVGKPYRTGNYLFILLSGIVVCVATSIALIWGPTVINGNTNLEVTWFGQGMLVSVLFLPFRDTERWGEVKVNQKVGEATLLWDRLMCEWNAGKRPRDWHVWILDFLAQCRKEGLIKPYTEYMRAYYYWDRGEFENANAQFDFAYELNPPNALNLERAFFKRIVMGDESDLEYPDLSNRLNKAKAFHKYESGEFLEAIRIAEEHIEEYLRDPKFHTPSLDFDRESMELLKKKAQEKLNLQKREF